MCHQNRRQPNFFLFAAKERQRLQPLYPDRPPINRKQQNLPANMLPLRVACNKAKRLTSIIIFFLLKQILNSSLALT